MGLKGYRLWVMGQLDSTCTAPPQRQLQGTQPVPSSSSSSTDSSDDYPAPTPADFCTPCLLVPKRDPHHPGAQINLRR
jgi:hypothetical protein